MAARPFVFAFSGVLGFGAWLLACGDDGLIRPPSSNAPADDSDVPTIPNPANGTVNDGGTGGFDNDAIAPLPDAAPLPPSPVGAAGGPDTLDVGSWNIEWFGSPTYGPTDDATQETNVRDVVNGAKLDVFAFEEVVDSDRWKRAIRSVQGWTGFVANDSSVQGGAAEYSADEQKLAFAYDTRTVQVTGARILLAASSYDFAGRPPLEVSATYTTPDARTVPLTFVVVHLKAGGDTEAWTRRQASITALKSALDSRATTESILIVGDWNDELATSKIKAKGSPFAGLVADTARYAFPTMVFEQTKTSTMAGEVFANDQHVLSIKASAFYVADSAAALRVDKDIPSYSDTTSDHFPIVTKYKP